MFKNLAFRLIFNGNSIISTDLVDQLILNALEEKSGKEIKSDMTYINQKCDYYQTAQNALNIINHHKKYG